ncbi:MAG TPA: BON domain-containing protein [Candidatus Sulfomarinibacteraceae bacterium]|nr:BON domain-containing protein [Candidatus Sulfomarinibacteraceae bacterium]
MQKMRALSGLAALVMIVFLAACGTDDTAREEMTDAWITSKVTANLTADPEINPFEIDVDTEDGVVRLSGMVETDLQREEAAKLAIRTEGVISVVNDIELGDLTLEENIEDGWIATTVESKLAADPEINPFDIDVDVLEGVVTLTGSVDTDRALQHAEELARRTEGVKGVENLLTIAS